MEMGQDFDIDREVEGLSSSVARLKQASCLVQYRACALLGLISLILQCAGRCPRLSQRRHTYPGPLQSSWYAFHQCVVISAILLYSLLCLCCKAASKMWTPAYIRDCSWSAHSVLPQKPGSYPVTAEIAFAVMWTMPWNCVKAA